MTGHRTIVETSRVTVLDLPAMEAVAAVHRASGALRSRAERQVLGPHRLTWTTWVVLQIVAVWKEIETRHVASEAGISKSTLTGVVATLDRRGLIRRRVHPSDARRVLLAPTEAGSDLVNHLLPRINAEETAMLDDIPREALGGLTQTLRDLSTRLEPRPADGWPGGGAGLPSGSERPDRPDPASAT